MEKHRLFLAIELPLEVQRKLAKKVKGLHLKYVHLRPQQQWHLTVKFFGLVEDDFVPTLIREIEEKLIRTGRFSLGINKTGVFPNAKRPKHVWVGVTGDLERLTWLAEIFKKDSDRDFVPHITVGTAQRAPTLKEKQYDVNIFLATQFQKPLWFEVCEVALFRSKLTHSNPIYTKVATFQLG